MTTVAPLPTPLELNRLYEPKKPSTVLHVLGSTALMVALGVALAWQESGPLLVFGLCGGLIGAFWGVVYSAGRWYLGNGQHAFELTEDGFTVIDKKGRLDVPWHKINYAEHCLLHCWSFKIEGPYRRAATISVATHGHQLMDAFEHLVRSRLPEHVEVTVVDINTTHYLDY